MLRNRLGYTTRVAAPYFLSARFAQVNDLYTFQVVVVFGGSKRRLEERLCFMPWHCLVTLGMNEDQLEP